jgi:hypothetical protein
LDAGDPPPIRYSNWNTGGFTVRLEVTSLSGETSVHEDHVTVWPLPTGEIVSPIGSSRMCENDSLLVTVSTAVNNPTFRWETEGFNNNPGVSFVTSNDSVFLTEPGSYRVTVIDEGGCESDYDDYIYIDGHEEIILTLYNNYIDIVDGTDTIELCHKPNENWLYVNALNLEDYNQNAFTWNNGHTGSNISLDSTAMYTLTVDDGLNACGAVSDSIYVIIHPLPTPEVVVSPDETEFCEGDIISLSTTGSYEEIMWGYNNGFYYVQAYAETINPEVSNTYSVTVTDEFGCRGSNESSFLSIKPRPLKPEVFVASGCFLAASSPPSGTSYVYQWSLEDEIISGEVDQYLDVETAGFYVVSVTSENGCANQSDPTYADCDISGVEALSAEGVTMYPNPFTESLLLNFNHSEMVTVSLVDMTGKLIATQMGQQRIILDGNTISPGIYALTIATHDSEITTKVVRQ